MHITLFNTRSINVCLNSLCMPGEHLTSIEAMMVFAPRSDSRAKRERVVTIVDFVAPLEPFWWDRVKRLVLNEVAQLEGAT